MHVATEDVLHSFAAAFVAESQSSEVAAGHPSAGADRSSPEAQKPIKISKRKTINCDAIQPGECKPPVTVEAAAGVAACEASKPSSPVVIEIFCGSARVTASL